MADDKSAPVTGQGATTPAQAAQVAMQDTVGSAASEPYFSYAYPDGKKEEFKSKDELAKAWRESYLRRSDYDRKNNERSQATKQFDEERKKFQEEQKAFLESRKRYDKWDEMLKTRPDVQTQLERLAGAPATPDAVFDRARGYVDENTQKLQERLDTLEKQLEKERTDKELQNTFAAMKQKYSDFDEGPIMERLEYLQDGKTEPLVDLLYWAVKGQMAPAQVEEKITENLAKKSAGRMVPAGGATVRSPPREFKTTDEAKEAAYAEYVGRVE